MTGFQVHPNLASRDELQRLSRRFVDEFLDKVKPCPPLSVDLYFQSADPPLETYPKKPTQESIESIVQDSRLMIRLSDDILRGVPALALQGWLDLELSRFLLEFDSKSCQFNFSRQILPRFPMSGSAVSLIRHIVECLAMALKKYLMTEMIIELDHGQSQVYFYFFRVSPSLEEEASYEKIRSRQWLRVLFLSKKLGEFISIALLAERQIEFAPDLEAYWWDCHRYLALEDRRLLEEVALIPDQHNKESYSFKLVEMFRKMRSRLSARSIARTAPESLH